MLEQLRIAYANEKRARYSLCIGTFLMGIFLLWISNGFPPHAWRFLLQTVPQVPHLWMLKGPSMLLPLLVLTLFSLGLLCGWVLLAVSLLWLAKQQWHYYCEQRDFDASLQMAEDLSMQDVDIRRLNTSGSSSQSQQWWEEDTADMPKNGVKVARASRPTSTPSLSAVNTVPPFQPSPPLSPVLSRPPLEPQPTSQVSTQPLKLRKQLKSNTASGCIEIEQAFRLAIGTGLDAGITRKNKPNEDNLLVIQGTYTYNTQAHSFGLFLIADGMGGHSKGQEASRMAIQHIRTVVIPTLLSNAEIDADHTRELLLDGVQHANLAVYQHNKQQQIDMGTTVTAVLMIDKTIVIANVGDSRTYFYSEQHGLKQVTKDHSVVGQLFERGEISEDDIYIHPQRNEIFRCIGEKASVLADTFTLPLEIGATFVLCSDGLWEMVKNPRIEQILRDTLPDAKQASKALIQAALDGGGKDNISVIVAHITSGTSELFSIRAVSQEDSPILPRPTLNGLSRHL